MNIMSTMRVFFSSFSVKRVIRMIIGIILGL
jgi:hypothetical protein